MLQKGFFITKSFNWAGRTLVNLSGSQQFVENTIFPKGVYRVDVVAGATFDGIGHDQPMTVNSKKGVGGKVYTEVTMEVPFIIRAYCGSKGNYGVGGTNPYSGPFKVNALYQESDVAAVNHIFGNRGGSASISGQTGQFPGSGNCLGDGVGVNSNNNEKWGIGAGSCLHFLPVGGTFGTDYLFAAHCAPAAIGWNGSPRCIAGCGSAYGGAAAGAAFYLNYTCYCWKGGSTPYGSGGIPVQYQYSGDCSAASGTGIGAGKCWLKSNGTMTSPTRGAAACFQDGVWANSDLYGNVDEDGHIIVTFVRPI